MGVEIYEYNLEENLETSTHYLHSEWVRRGKPEKKYTQADVVYIASYRALERALRSQVDGVLIFSAMFFHPDLFVLMRRAHIRTAALLSESPYDDDMQARDLPYIDVAWTNERSSVRTLRQANPNVNYMPHAYNPDLHYPVGGDAHSPEPERDMKWGEESDVPSHDVVFVGSMFAERVDLLSQVDWTGIDLGLYGEWSGLPSRHKLRKYVKRGVVNNWYAAALYRKAKIGLNLYRESMGWGKDAPRLPTGSAESMNPRTLELAACGCFQLSQWRSEIAETFGTSVPTFENVTEMERLIHYYLLAAGERKLRAHKALQAVQPHTFAARAQSIVNDLERAEWTPVCELVAAG